MGVNPHSQQIKSCGTPSQKKSICFSSSVWELEVEQLCMDWTVGFPHTSDHENQKQGCVAVFTVRPASLLCRFIAERASGRFSLASANSLDTNTPNSASSLQPPHFHPSPGGPLWWESQPHMVDVPSAQERVTAYATPAEAMAWTNADSRVAEIWYEDRKRERDIQSVKHGRGQSLQLPTSRQR